VLNPKNINTEETEKREDHGESSKPRDAPARARIAIVYAKLAAYK
jgi:hypothetical protein